MRAPAFWWREKPSLGARLLSPLGFFFGRVSERRMSRHGLRVEVPVLCIGNFVAGGAGKTPVALAAARLLAAHGERPMFLSRGYGGALSSSVPLRVDTQRHDSGMVGDEPLLLAREAPTFICTDRVAGAKAAADAGASVVVLDDGMQNPSLDKTLSLTVVDGATGLGNGLCVPAGPLRAPMSAQWRKADAVLVVGSGDAGRRAAELAAAAGRTVFTARLTPDANAAAKIAGRRVVAFAGIGRPEKFFATLEECGAEIVARRAFGDHHAFRMADLTAMRRLARDSGAEFLVTTEKDAQRLPRSQMLDGLAVLPVTLTFDDADDFLAWLTGGLSA